MNESKYTEKEIRALTDKHVCKVIFNKRDKSSREMICTSNWKWLSRDDVRKAVGFNPPSNDGSRPKKEWKPGQIGVYDLDLEDWRSFYAKKVTHIEIFQDLSPENITI